MPPRKELFFIFLSCLCTVIHAAGYAWMGLQEGYTICIIAMIVLDLLYIPAITIQNVKLFPIYLILFSVSLVFITAFITSELFNNYSGLLCIFIAVLIIPKYKYNLLILYLVVSAIAFCIAGDSVYCLVIHYSRTLWLSLIYDFVIYAKYERKPVILFDEEIEILEQLSNGEQIKSLELNGMSERTIRRRLDAAQKRNGLKNGAEGRKELKDLYKRTYKK